MMHRAEPVLQRRVALIAPERPDGSGLTAEQLAEALPAGAELLHVPRAGDHEPLERWAARALDAGAELVVAAGGDGSVSAVAAALVNKPDRALAIAPCGTSNSIGAHFGIASVADGLACLRDGQRVTIDTALCNGRPMLLMATLGVHADAVLGAGSENKARLGVLAYAYEELTRLFDHDKLDAVVWVDGFRFELCASAITIANLGPAKSPLVHGAGGPIEDDGLLDLTVFACGGLADGVLKLAHLTRCALAGTAASAPDVFGVRGRELRVSLAAKRSVMVDGEDRGEGDLVVRVVPRSLTVLVPAGYMPRVP
jgi:diacylglycerol kinase family enzyme